MKKRFLFFIFLFQLGFAYGDKIELSGIFLGKNLYVMNPFSDSGIGFCVYEVSVNGQITGDELNSSAFEIDLSQFHFTIGEKISITLRYKNGCLPRIINPEAIKPKSTFSLQNASVDKKGVLHWTTQGELGSLPFVVQQFRWNKWITVGETDGKGTPETNKYELDVRPHSGKNLFRIFQLDYTEVPRYSSDIIYVSTSDPIYFGPEKVKTELLFTHSTLYEIYDSYGNIIFKGFGDKINLEGLQNGLYYINYDNTMGSFNKK